MEGLEGWEYPYDAVLIDEKQGEVVAFWRQVAPGDARRRHALRDRAASAARGSATPATTSGRWQRDFFDFGNAMALLHGADPGRQAQRAGMQKRIERVMAGEVMPGHVKHEAES